MALKLMYLTNDTTVAQIAQTAGVDRIFIDLEKLGKAERQGHVDSVKSDHRIEDVAKIRPFLEEAALLVRVNPLNPLSAGEINAVIENGAELVMLPMFKTIEAVKTFIDMVSGRAKTILLLETAEAEARIDEILKIPGIDEIHIGLNDLHLAHGMKFMFQLLADGTVEKLCRKIAAKGIPYGFGGVSSVGGGEKLPAERILAEHYRLGSSMVILSRSFCNTAVIDELDNVERTFNAGVKNIRKLENFLSCQPEEFFFNNALEVKRIVGGIVGENYEA